MQSAIQEPVDENNSVVKDLIAAGYSEEQSIEAVERCGILDAALEYLEEVAMVESEEENESEFIPSTQLSYEDSYPADDFRMIW